MPVAEEEEEAEQGGDGASGQDAHGRTFPATLSFRAKLAQVRPCVARDAYSGRCSHATAPAYPPHPHPRTLTLT